MSELPSELKPLNPPFRPFFKALVNDLGKQSNQRLELQFGEVAAFQCSLCGQCCKHPWKISVSQAYYETWSDFFAQDPSGRFAQPFLKLSQPSPARFASFRRRSSDNACVFLNPDNSCHIHRSLGEKHLPEVCRSYPRLAQRILPSFDFKSLDLSCVEVPALMFQERQLYYALRPLDLSEALKYPSRRQNFWPHHTNLYYLWLGEVLDFWEGSQTALTKLGALLPVLYQLWQLPPRQQDPELIYACFEKSLNPLEPDLGISPAAEDLLQIFAQAVLFAPALVKILETAWQNPSFPSLNSTEQRVLNDFLNEYLRRRLLLLTHEFSYLSPLNLIQAYGFCAHLVCLIQLMALALSEAKQERLSLPLLSLATQCIEVYCVHHLGWVQRQDYAHWSPEQVLKNAKGYLAFDLGENPVPWRERCG